MKKVIISLFLLFCIIGCAWGGESYSDHTYIFDGNDYSNYEIAYALEDGHFDTLFSEDYKGYCVEYTEQEAAYGDLFYITNTSSIINRITNEDVSNYLKIYFIDYYNQTQANKIVTQHTIWHFTDNFDGWRINYTLVDEIRDSTHNYPDSGTIRYNDTHKMIYDFRGLVSPYEEHQNYFNYKIFFKEIGVDDCIINNYNNTTNVNNYNNTTNIVNNYNNTTNIVNNYNNTTNIVNNYNNTTNIINNYNNTTNINNYNNTTNNYLINITNNTTVNNIANNYSNITNYYNNIINNITNNTTNNNITVNNAPTNNANSKIYIIIIHKIIHMNNYVQQANMMYQHPNSIDLFRYQTGNPIIILIGCLFIATGVIIISKK